MTEIEAVARAICEAQGLNPDDPWPVVGYRWVSWSGPAYAAIEAVRQYSVEGRSE